MDMNLDPSLVFEAENDEDTFYADIRRQILLLTSEDSEDLPETRCYNPISVNMYGGLNKRSCGLKCASPPANNFCSWETQLLFTNPLWLVNLWKNGKGTGVFIPQVTCRKYQTSGRENKRKIYRPVVRKDSRI